MLTAFRVLLDDAPAERAQLALKIAIRTLVDTPRGARISNRSPNISAADQEHWSQLKPRIRSYIAARKVGMSVIAKATGLPLSTVQRALSPAGPAPGRALVDLLERWLSDQADDANAPVRIDNGSAPAAVTKPAAAHARAGPLPANRLTKDEADELADYLDHTEEREIRNELGLVPAPGQESRDPRSRSAGRDHRPNTDIFGDRLGRLNFPIGPHDHEAVQSGHR